MHWEPFLPTPRIPRPQQYVRSVPVRELPVRSLSDAGFQTSSIQHLPNGAGHFVHDNRFRDKGADPQFPGCVCVDLFAVSGAQDNGDVRPDQQEFTGQLFAGHVRHGHIRNNQVKSLWLIAEGLQGLDAVAPCRDAVAQTLEHNPDCINGPGFIVHQEDPFRPSRERRLPF